MGFLGSGTKYSAALSHCPAIGGSRFGLEPAQVLHLHITLNLA